MLHQHDSAEGQPDTFASLPSHSHEGYYPECGCVLDPLDVGATTN